MTKKKLKYDLKKENPTSYWAGVGLFAGTAILFTVLLIMSLNSGQERTFYSVGVFVIMIVFSLLWLVLLLTRAYERFYGDHKKWIDTWGVAIPNMLIGGIIMSASIYFLVSEWFNWGGLIGMFIGFAWAAMSYFVAKYNNKY